VREQAHPEAVLLSQVNVQAKVITAFSIVAFVLCAPSAHALTLANVIDLRTTGASGGVNGAWFYQNWSQPAGNDTYDSFLRLQDRPMEEAFNTDYRHNGRAPLDGVGSSSFNHAIRLGDLATVSKGGVDYYAFSLDLDEPDHGSGRYVSLDELKFYVSNDEDLSSLSALTNPSKATLKWSLDARHNTTVYLDGGAHSPGNGPDDMQVLIPKSAFAGVGADKYLYLYSKFGATSGMGCDNFNTNWGCEEWRTLKRCPPSAAEPSTLWLLCAGVVGAVLIGRRNQRRA
jgi:hypothetical protein